MAIEPRRGCGYRKVGGLYLVSAGLAEPCHRLPVPLDVCPVCGGGVKQTRGWTWVDGPGLFAGPCDAPDNRGTLPPPISAEHCERCAVCRPAKLGRCGLLWIGARFYRTPADFTTEAAHLGVSRRLSAIPRGFDLGVTWVLVAHPTACTNRVAAPLQDVLFEGEGPARETAGPGIFHAFRPERIELLIRASEATPAKLAELERRGITPVVVPDDDKDHQGTVYDDEADTPEDQAA